jgi:hypothetical protein
LPSAYRDYRFSDRYPALLRAYKEAEDVALSHDWLTWKGVADRPAEFSTEEEWRTQVQAVAPEAYAHAYSIRQFVLLADRAKLAIRVPEALWHFPNPDYPILAAFLKGDHDDRVIGPVFAVAQHHGMLTPLLDWTYDSVIAAYFAAEQALLAPSSEPLAVWALSEDYLNESKAEIERVTIEPQVTPFLDAQEGLFIWHPKAYLYLRHRRYLSFDKVIRRDFEKMKPTDTWLWKLTLPSSEARDLVNLLWHEKVSRAYLMPGFDSVAKTLELRARWSGKV